MKRIYTFLIASLFLSFSLFASDLPSLIPKAKGWTLVEKPKFYSPEKLFEHIDGASEVYLSFGFKGLMVVYFEKGRSSLTLEIYEMKSPKHSFGIYSIERSSENVFIEIGNQGYTDGENLFFIIGTFYVKLLCSECGPTFIDELKNFANEIVGKVKDRGEIPKVLKYFPEEGIIKNSEKFFPENFLGIDFLKEGYLADYELEGEKFSLFIIEEYQEKDAENTFHKFKSYLESKKISKKFTIGSMEGVVAEEKVYGKIAMVRKGSFIIGYLGNQDLEKIKKYLEDCIKRTEVPK